MVVEVFIVVGADVAARKNIFKVLEEDGIDRHDVFEVTVHCTILHHQNLAVALNDLSLDFANLLILEDLDRQFAVDDLVADVGDALGAQGVCRAGPAEGRLGLLVALEERLLRPLRGKRRVRVDGI